MFPWSSDVHLKHLKVVWVDIYVSQLAYIEIIQRVLLVNDLHTTDVCIRSVDMGRMPF